MRNQFHWICASAHFWFVSLDSSRWETDEGEVDLGVEVFDGVNWKFIGLWMFGILKYRETLTEWTESIHSQSLNDWPFLSVKHKTVPEIHCTLHLLQLLPPDCEEYSFLLCVWSKTHLSRNIIVGWVVLKELSLFAHLVHSLWKIYTSSKHQNWAPELDSCQSCHLSKLLLEWKNFPLCGFLTL